jgi:protein phosphatase
MPLQSHEAICRTRNTMLSSELSKPISLEPQLCCPNAQCSAPLNAIGEKECHHCHTPLPYRYLWAVGDLAEQSLPGSQIAGRYYVVAANIWLDTQPGLTPDIPLDWSEAVLPYLYLYPYSLHVPQVYGFCPAAKGAGLTDTFLLENVPLDASGNLLPSMAQLWSQASATRQLYWLWQILHLWQPLQEQGVACSLLIADNLRVEGWRLRLRQLYVDADVFDLPTMVGEPSTALLQLADLGNFWLDWVEKAQSDLLAPLRELCEAMQAGQPIADIAHQLNSLLLEHAGQLPLRLRMAGATDAGRDRPHNEDTCYPITKNNQLTLFEGPQGDGLVPRLAIVCDGIGGHEGGEVASQMALQSLKLQAQALLAEVAEQPEMMTPTVVTQQLESIVRVVNNLIASQNDHQGRRDRRRMGTTLVMALQIPQQIPLPAGSATTGLGATGSGVTGPGDTGSGMTGNSHELYLVHVGDSRAYWITERYCQRLTVDDDVVARETRLGRSLHREALLRPDATALTQALGTRDADQLVPTVQRFILEEDGMLLLCSDGLSDQDIVEKHWIDITESLMRGQRSLEETAQAWIDLANQKNGHDNISVVLLQCAVSSTVTDPVLPPLSEPEEAGWVPSSQALMEEDSTGPSRRRSPVTAKPHRWEWLPSAVGFLTALAIAGGIGFFIWHSKQQTVPPTPSPAGPTMPSPTSLDPALPQGDTPRSGSAFVQPSAELPNQEADSSPPRSGGE